MDNDIIKFHSLVDEIAVDTSRSLREIFDESQKFIFGASQIPLELRERKIKQAMVNCIRHTGGIGYDDGIKRSHNINRDFRNDNYKQYKNAVLIRIAREYPFLKKECFMQRYDVQMVSVLEGDGS